MPLPPFEACTKKIKMLFFSWSIFFFPCLQPSTHFCQPCKTWTICRPQWWCLDRAGYSLKFSLWLWSCRLAPLIRRAPQGNRGRFGISIEAKKGEREALPVILLSAIHLPFLSLYIYTTFSLNPPPDCTPSPFGQVSCKRETEAMRPAATHLPTDSPHTHIARCLHFLINSLKNSQGRLPKTH